MKDTVRAILPPSYQLNFNRSDRFLFAEKLSSKNIKFGSENCPIEENLVKAECCKKLNRATLKFKAPIGLSHL